MCVYYIFEIDMTCYFITRHPGALEWASQQGLMFDIHLTHVSDLNMFVKDDKVAGTLPVNLAAELCARGVSYYHLTLEIPESLRGQELNAGQLDQCHATLKAFKVSQVDNS